MLIVNSASGLIFNFDNIVSIGSTYDDNNYSIIHNSTGSLSTIAKFKQKEDMIDAIDKIIAYYESNKKVVFIEDKLEDKYAADRT
jgi:hypothetical protein